MPDTFRALDLPLRIDGAPTDRPLAVRLHRPVPESWLVQSTIDAMPGSLSVTSGFMTTTGDPVAVSHVVRCTDRTVAVAPIMRTVEWPRWQGLRATGGLCVLEHLQVLCEHAAEWLGSMVAVITDGEALEPVGCEGPPSVTARPARPRLPDPTFAGGGRIVAAGAGVTTMTPVASGPTRDAPRRIGDAPVHDLATGRAARREARLHDRLRGRGGDPFGGWELPDPSPGGGVAA
jgi:hypothetical protein